MIRPERIRILDVDAGGANTLTGHVEDSSYIGDSTRLQVRMRDDLVNAVRHQNQRSRRLHVLVGTTVALGWDAEDALAFASGARRP